MDFDESPEEQRLMVEAIEEALGHRLTERARESVLLSISIVILEDRERLLEEIIADEDHPDSQLTVIYELRAELARQRILRVDLESKHVKAQAEVKAAQALTKKAVAQAREEEREIFRDAAKRMVANKLPPKWWAYFVLGKLSP